MAKGKPRPGRKVHVHSGDCRCSKKTPGSHKWHDSKTPKYRDLSKMPEDELRDLANAIQDAKAKR